MGPLPPTMLTADPSVDRVVMGVMAALMLAALTFAIVDLLRSGRPVVLMLFIAGGCMMVMEPMVDTVAGCWFAANSLRAYVGWGRPIPIWVCLTYFVYFGVGSALIWMMMRRGASVRHIWLFYAGEILADVVLETVLLGKGIYTYYGHQPLMLAGFPLWWAAVNALVSMMAALATYEIARRVDGWRLLLIVPATLCASAAANAAAGWPSWFVINSDVGPVWTQIGGLASVAIAFSIVQLIARYVAAPASLRPALHIAPRRPELVA